MRFGVSKKKKIQILEKMTEVEPEEHSLFHEAVLCFKRDQPRQVSLSGLITVV